MLPPGALAGAVPPGALPPGGVVARGPALDEETIGFDIPADVVDRVLVSNWTRGVEMKTGARVVVSRTSGGGAHLDFHGQPEQVVEAESLAEDAVRRASALAAAGEPIQPPPPPGPPPNVAGVSKAASKAAAAAAAKASLPPVPQQSPALGMIVPGAPGASMLQRPATLLSAPAPVAAPVADGSAATTATTMPPRPTPPWATAAAAATTTATAPSWLTSGNSGGATGSASAPTAPSWLAGGGCTGPSWLAADNAVGAVACGGTCASSGPGRPDAGASLPPPPTGAVPGVPAAGGAWSMPVRPSMAPIPPPPFTTVVAAPAAQAVVPPWQVAAQQQLAVQAVMMIPGAPPVPPPPPTPPPS